MAEPARDRQNVHAGGDQLRGMRVPQAVQRHALDSERPHRQREFLGEPMPMRRAHSAVALEHGAQNLQIAAVISRPEICRLNQNSHPAVGLMRLVKEEPKC
jgi:hypothetical protein